MIPSPLTVIPSCPLGTVHPVAVFLMTTSTGWSVPVGVYVSVISSIPAAGVTVTLASVGFGVTVGAAGVASFVGSFAVPASLASLFPFVATALTAVPSSATV